MKKTFIILSMALASVSAGATGLVINEMMQSNLDCIMDDLNEFPDSWVELYNDSASPVNLKDYSLGVKEKASKAYTLPDMTIAAHGFALIYCDKEEKGLHTSFRLESGKNGEVYLFKGNEIVDKVTGMKAQPAPGIAYGRVTDGAGEWGYQCKPTPGSSNSGKVSSQLLPDPVFSIEGQVMKTSGTLTLSMPGGVPAGTVIRYTTDGKEPTENSSLYVVPINMHTSKVIRAKLFCDGYLSPRSVTHSYIFFPREMTLPIVSVVTDNGYFYDSKIGIYVEGSYTAGTPNYRYDWRRCANIEMFEAPGEPAVINQICETRVKGGATRDAKYKSLVFYANKRFGTKRFDYEFFPDQRPGVTDFKSFEMRNAGNDFDYLYMRDAVIQRSMAQNVDLDWQAWRPAIFMLNGQYVCMLNIRERSNEDNIYTNYDGLEDIDMIENWWELKSGDMTNYQAFQTFYGEHGHTLDEFKEWMDVTEFANLMIMNIFYNNQDFPGNNIVMWRPIDNGKWRWVAKDTDFGLGLYGSSPEYKTLNWLYTPGYDKDRDWANGYEHTRLFRRLIDIDDFKKDFIDRFAVYMGDFLNGKHINSLLDEMYGIIKTEYPNHRANINQWWPNYSDELRSAKNYATNRTTFMYKHLKDFWNLGNAVPLTVGKNSSQKVCLTVNGIDLRNDFLDGSFYAGRSLKISGVPADDTKEVSGWTVKTTSAGKTSSVTYNTPELNLTMPDAQSVAVEPVIAEKSGINDIVADEVDTTRPVEVFDLYGRRVSDNASDLPAGIYVFRQGNKVYKQAVH